MENKEIIPVTFRWEMWENHVNPTYFALYRNNMISYEELDKYMEESHYKDYLRQEIKDRIKRHEPILSLLDMSEKQNENCKKTSCTCACADYGAVHPRILLRSGRS